ncbi:hypothetical protein PAN31117_03044 [Pandoraea anapnoica]|uniref:Uncharacterized protein n=1 Tax=Pandoraea anapnoica TaxID=2508301 RepID=A0A5E5A878_9BURK|nr:MULTISPECIES: hypothetical protein [Pandoraea]VVE15197.1 hypothetical protein PIN31009_02839 [Pandoraea iniqua]VVE68735.1 hypothetical protein PAN31117_03044 [Pandoraea anapnoica]
MTHTETILKYIVEHPGSSAAQVADGCNLSIEDISDLLLPSITNGKVIKDPQGRGSVVFYHPSQSLIREFLPVGAPARGRPRKAVAQSTSDDGDFSCGFYTDGRLCITKKNKEIFLTSGERASLVGFLDAINIDLITGAAQ